MFLLIRLLRLFLSRRWGWMILGVVLLCIGVAFGASSHQVTYQPITNGNFTPYVVDGGTDYLQASDGSTYYVIKESDLSPHFDGTTVFGGGQKMFAILTSSDTEDVDVQLTDGTHLQGTGYEVERIAQIDTSSGQPMQIYTTTEYTQHPNGFYENKWGWGIGTIMFGLLAFCLGLFAPRLFKNRRQKASAPAPVMMGNSEQAIPYQQANAYQQTPNPYMQPYAGPSQYPQYQQEYPSYPAQPGGYDPTQIAGSEEIPPQN
ncbi:MAG TPA: hypothetical protein VIZ18_20115 [Ktedonobacteraceae bacterium]